ncbi:DUF72 domain-containing protein [Paraliomyxa miuraensis]|uniref:DUF72 domain-containing protein n=1 Tax=Paraliomyxa miuraensis TaxID=376150 RepID=UPI002257CEAB|nr:DUF72 domain-containing protein [Paraliomyxa miuraensis]MCX4243438.1 DUF72 domain-containing protein [Paraliomyxa miuraensis]
MIQRAFLGLPVWNRADWTGELYPPGTPASQRLAAYARIFNAVEGNTTFYATPPPTTVARWVEQTGPRFRFCFKLPRAITHERMLVNASREAEAFMEVLAPLRERLGPVLVQLPPRFGPERLPSLEDFLLTLPPVAPYAVEVRHPGYFEGAAQDELNAMLGELGMDRAVIDTRGVHEAEGDDPDLARAHERKPRLPAPAVATGRHPMLRYVANPELPANDARLIAWAEQVVSWLEEGREPYLFMHVPDDFFAPRLARRFFEHLTARAEVGTLPAFGSAAHDHPGERRPARQVSLFSEDPEG